MKGKSRYAKFTNIDIILQAISHAQRHVREHAAAEIEHQYLVQHVGCHQLDDYCHRKDSKSLEKRSPDQNQINSFTNVDADAVN